MKKTFLEFYKPTDDEFASLWKDCFFSLDANVLLNLYRYKIDTREDFISLLDASKERFWLSFQAANEYFRNRIDVIVKQSKDYDDIKKIIDEFESSYCGRLSAFSKHSNIDISLMESTIRKTSAALKKQVSDSKDKHPDLLDRDPILNSLTKIFDGRIGTCLATAELNEKYSEIDKRYASKIPPGFEDANKTDARKYGDALIWFELLAEAKSRNKPVIFITDDVKKDWWQFNGSNIIGPHPYLIREMNDIAGVKFYIYTSEKFLVFAGKHLLKKPKNETVKDVKQTQDKINLSSNSPLADLFQTTLSNPNNSTNPFTTLNRGIVLNDKNLNVQNGIKISGSASPPTIQSLFANPQSFSVSHINNTSKKCTVCGHINTYTANTIVFSPRICEVCRSLLI